VSKPNLVISTLGFWRVLPTLTRLTPLFHHFPTDPPFKTAKTHPMSLSHVKTGLLSEPLFQTHVDCHINLVPNGLQKRVTFAKTCDMCVHTKNWVVALLAHDTVTHIVRTQQNPHMSTSRLRTLCHTLFPRLPFSPLFTRVNLATFGTTFLTKKTRKLPKYSLHN